MNESRYPEGWDEARVQRVLDHYASQSEDEAVAEDEESFLDDSQTTMVVPKELVAEIDALIARRKRD